MTFFWKLYFCIMLCIMSCFSIGSYFLIESGFHSSLEREIENAYHENNIINSIFNQLTLPSSYTIINYESYQKKEIQYYLDKLSVQNDLNILYCLRDEEGHVLYMDGSFQDDKSLVEKVSHLQQAYRIVEDHGKYYIHTIKPSFQNIFVENKKDITSIFDSRDRQIHLFFVDACVLLFISSIVIYLITKWLVSPIRSLSQATKEINIHKDFQPIPVHGHDEIAQLTQDFNVMSVRLQSAMQELEEKAEKQDLFVGNFAHELKTPLTTIIGYGDMLRSKKISEEQLITYADHIVKEGKRLESLSMKLLELIVLKKKDFVFQHVSSQYFFQNTKENFLVSRQEKHIDMIVDVEEDFLWIEPDLMNSVIINLLDNAYKSIDHEGIIQLKGKKDNNGYVIKISDNGCGMEDNEISHIMEAFYMIDKSRSRTHGGAGLGLAIVKEILDIHQAELKIESQLHKGTQISIYLKGEQ